MDSNVIRKMSHFRRCSDRESGTMIVGGFNKANPDSRREYVNAMSRRTKARAARLYSEFNAAVFDVCAIGSGETDESGNKDFVLGDFVIVVVAVGIDGSR